MRSIPPRLVFSSPSVVVGVSSACTRGGRGGVWGSFGQTPTDHCCLASSFCSAQRSLLMSSSSSPFSSLEEAHRSNVGMAAVSVQRRDFSSGTDPHRIRQLRKSLFPNARIMGRDGQSTAFERMIKIMKMGSFEKSTQQQNSSDLSSTSTCREGTALQEVGGGDEDAQLTFRMGSNMQAAAMVLNTAVVKYVPSVEHIAASEGGTYPSAVVRRVCQKGDCKIMGARVTSNGNLEPAFDPVTGIASADAERGRGRLYQGRGSSQFGYLTLYPKNKPIEHAIIYCVQPIINSHEFRFEEAQVELINTYRNMLVEVAETEGIHRLVFPPLCLYTAGRMHRYTIAKLNQSAIIKAFHKLSTCDKDEILGRNGGNFSVEVYVDDAHYDDFVATFKENAWEPPTNLLYPERMDLYPGLAPPEGMREMEGWVGKRPELIEAIETKGKSLIDGRAKYALDGTPIVPLDATMFGRVHQSTREQRIVAEHATARKLGYIPEPLTELGSGLLGDLYTPDVRPSEDVVAEAEKEAAESKADAAEVKPEVWVSDLQMDCAEKASKDDAQFRD